MMLETRRSQVSRLLQLTVRLAMVIQLRFVEDRVSLGVESGYIVRKELEWKSF